MIKIRSRSHSPCGYNVYISNLPLTFPQPRLFSMFSKFGDVKNIKMSLPEACVTLKTESSAKEAIKCLSAQGWLVSFSKKASIEISGLLRKDKFPTVPVTMKIIFGSFPKDLYSLSVNDRGTEPILDKILGVWVISASEGQEKAMKVYVEYLITMKRQGIVSLGRDLIVILPKCELSDCYYRDLKENQLIALHLKRQISSSMKQLQIFLENNPFKE